MDQAIRLVRHNFLTFIGIIALAEIPLLLVQTALALFYKGTPALSGSSSDDLFSAHWFITNLVIFSVHWIFVDGLGSAVLTYAIARRYLHLDAGILQSYRGLGLAWLKVIAMLFVAGILEFLAVIWMMVPCVGWFSGPGLLIFLAAAVVPFLPAAVVLEKQAGLNAIPRAWDLARRRFMWILGFAVVLLFFNWILFSGPSLLTTLLASTVIDSLPGHSATFDTIYPLVSSVSGTLFSVLFLPIQVAAWTVIYFDLRVRTEGFDLALQAANDLQEAQRLVDLPPVQKWVAAEDVAKIFLISVCVVVFFAVINLMPFLLILFIALTPK